MDTNQGVCNCVSNMDDNDNDIIEVTYEDFWNAQNNIDQENIDPKVQAKFQQLLTSYDCFTKDIQFYAPPSSHHDFYKSKRNSNFNKNNSRRYISHGHSVYHNSNIKKHPLKDVQALLNKITVSSCDAITQKLVRICAQKDDISEVVELVIQKCYKHGTYAHLYHNLLCEMYNRYACQVKNATSVFVKVFADDLASELNKLEVEPNPVEFYDDYCTYIKQKTVLMKKLECVLTINKRYGDIALNDTIVDVVFDVLNDAIISKNHVLLDFIDLISQIISIMNHEKVIGTEKLKSLSHIYSNIRDTFVPLPKKLQFSWENILAQ